jgi:hypothetical protein
VRDGLHTKDHVTANASTLYPGADSADSGIEVPPVVQGKVDIPAAMVSTSGHVKGWNAGRFAGFLFQAGALKLRIAPRARGQRDLLRPVAMNDKLEPRPLGLAVVSHFVAVMGTRHRMNVVRRAEQGSWGRCRRQFADWPDQELTRVALKDARRDLGPLPGPMALRCATSGVGRTRVAGGGDRDRPCQIAAPVGARAARHRQRACHEHAEAQFGVWGSRSWRRAFRAIHDSSIEQRKAEHSLP